MPCSHCGSTLPPGAGRCPVCGRPVDHTPAESAGQEPITQPARPEQAGEGAAFFQEIFSRPAPPPQETPPDTPAPAENKGPEPSPEGQPSPEGEAPAETPAEAPAETQPPVPRRRRWLPVALGGGALVLLVAAALVIRWLILGENQPLFYLSQDTLYYCYDVDTQPQALLEGVASGAIALTADGKSAVLAVPDNSWVSLYWLELGKEAAITLVDTGLARDFFPLNTDCITDMRLTESAQFYLDETGVLFYQKPTELGSRRMDLYRWDGGAPQLLKENVGDTLYCSPDGSTLLVEQYGEDRGLIRRSAQPGGEEELIYAGEDIRVIWSDSDGFSQILYSTGDVFYAAEGGDGLTLYRWTPEEGSQTLIADVTQVVRAEGPDSIYYTRGDPDQMAELDLGDYVVSKPVSALYHWQDGTETLVCDQILQCYLLQDDLLLYWPYNPDGYEDFLHLEAPLAVCPIGGEPVVLEGLWGGATMDDDGTLYGLEDGGTLVYYTRAGGYADRTEIASDVAYYTLDGNYLYYSRYVDSSTLNVYRLEGEQAVPVVEEADTFQVDLYRDGAALIYRREAGISSPSAVAAKALAGDLIYQSAGGRQRSLGGEISAVQRLEGDDLLVLSEEGTLSLDREGQSIPLAQEVDDFCVPGGEQPYSF